MSLPGVILVGKDPQGKTLGTRIGRIDLSGSDGGQVIRRSSVNAKHVMTVGSVSPEHAALRAHSDAPTTADLGRCSGATPDGTSW